MKNISIFLLICFIFCFGCAPKISIVDNNNIKIPDSVYISQDIESNLEINVFLAVMKKESGKYKPLKYLNLNSQETYKLGSDVNLMMGKVRINNPQNISYYLKTEHSDSKKELIYQGNAEKKVFTLYKNIDNIKLSKYSIVVGKLMDSNTIFDIHVEYKKSFNQKHRIGGR